MCFLGFLHYFLEFFYVSFLGFSMFSRVSLLFVRVLYVFSQVFYAFSSNSPLFSRMF